jgi:predicted transcriptional regulator
MSIRPRYVEEIKKGTKKWEFRRRIFKNKIDKIYIYCSAPVQKIVGYFVPGKILENSLQNIWEQCKEFSGIKKQEFFDYFEGKNKAYAIEILRVIFFETPFNPFKIIPNFVAPQSFYYMNNIDLRRAS